MNKPLMTAVVLLSIGSAAQGGTVEFDPATVAIDIPTGVTSVSVDVYIESSGALETFNSLDLLIGSNDLTIAQFAFAPEFEAVSDLRAVDPPPDPSPYASSIVVSAFAFDAITAPVLVGTLTIDASGLPVGMYRVTVDSDTDGGRSVLGSAVQGSVPEPLFGSATVGVIDSSTTPPAVDCTTDADCGAADVCTTVTCVKTQCVTSPIQDCRACAADGDCDDGNPCSDEACIESLCHYAENAAPCDDGEPCTENDTCSAYACAGTPIDGCGDSGPNGGTGGDPNVPDGQGDAPTGSTPGLCGAAGLIPLLISFLGLTSIRYRRTRARVLFGAPRRAGYCLPSSQRKR